MASTVRPARECCFPVEARLSLTESSFIAYLRGRANLAPIQPSTGMPNYSATTLSDAQARDIYAYVRTFKSNTPDVNDIAVLKQILSAAQKPYKP